MKIIDGYVSNRLIREQATTEFESARKRIFTILEFGGTVPDSLLVLFSDGPPPSHSYDKADGQ